MNVQRTRTVHPAIVFILAACLICSATVLAEAPAPIGRFQSCVANGLGLAVLDTCTGQVWDVWTGAAESLKPAKSDGLPVGRFQWPVSMGNLPGAYVIDSATGKVWQFKDPEFHEVKLHLPAR